MASKRTRKTKPTAQRSTPKAAPAKPKIPEMSQEDWLAAFVGPQKPVMPPPTGNLTAEFEQQTRQAPASLIPDMGVLTKLLPAWMNLPEEAVGTAPTNVWTWGYPDYKYNIQGAFRHSTPDKIGLMNQDYESALRGEPSGLGTVANELTHFYQYHNPKRQRITATYKPTPQEINNRVATGRYDLSPFVVENNKVVHKPHYYDEDELESTLINDWASLFIQALRAEEQQRKYAPDLRPH